MRKSRAKNRQVIPDPKFKNELVSKFVNNLMVDGKKSLAYSIFYGAIEIVEQRTNEDGVEVFKTALNNVVPAVEVKSRRVGGATFQVPTEVKPKRKEGLGIRWMIRYAKSRNGKSMREKLAAEIMAAAKGEGGAVKKKEDTHRMAEANKAFSHFRF
ncbi:30S ribosomal protein S7 [Pontibacter sp. G13]|uniref:30S ribosomal protein S7 n=1 Tax=Pontibacter sp. G13 TaxID=3074898 RepID=UPI0028896318|nr:30S ribosomal protein S7 [Pontibacter sp. G13]WNJ16514.1 30S ribosomal protein S7 [Pontibacter sp. G13]